MGWTTVANLRGPAGVDGSGSGSDVEQLDGNYTLENIQSTTFNGFKYNPWTGRLHVDQLTGDTPVRLPQDNVRNARDYWNWVFTKRTLAFRWDDTKPTHLLMEVS